MAGVIVQAQVLLLLSRPLMVNVHSDQTMSPRLGRSLFTSWSAGTSIVRHVLVRDRDLNLRRKNLHRRATRLRARINAALHSAIGRTIGQSNRAAVPRNGALAA